MPKDVVYAEEVTTHRGAVGRHVRWDKPHAYYKTNGGLGQGLGLALGVKLAKGNQPVVALMGDGGFLYNPVTACFGVACEANLPFLTVLFNNGCYEAMKGNHLAYYPDGDAAQAGHLARRQHSGAGLRQTRGTLWRLRGTGRRPVAIAPGAPQWLDSGSGGPHRSNRRRPQQVTSRPASSTAKAINCSSAP